MNTDVVFRFDPMDKNGNRLVKAYQTENLLAQDKFDPLQAWKAEPFLKKVCGAMEGAGRYESFDYAVGCLTEDFDESVKAIPADGADATETHKPVLQSMADVVSKPINWLWQDRFALGKLSLVIGDPGNGKSFWSLDTAARISVSCKWPDNRGNAPLGSVILMGVEDDLADTVKPRLEAAGADVSKIIALTGVANKDSAGEYERTVDLRRDIPVLEAAMISVPDLRVIVIDPISAFMGKTDSHVNAEVRETLAPLSLLAEKYGVAIIAITHLRKGETAALHRAMGSVAFTAAARSVWAIAKDKKDPEGKRRLLLPVKSNISEDHGGLAFILTKQHGTPGEMPHIEYLAEPVNESADDALSNEPRKRGPSAESQEDAEQFLRDALADGPKPTKEIESDAKQGYGISARTLERARKSIGVQSFRETVPGPWLLRLSNTASNTANCSKYKQPGGLGGLGENTKKNSKTTPDDSNTATLFVRGAVAANGHDIDAINGMLCEAGESSDPRLTDKLNDFLEGF